MASGSATSSYFFILFKLFIVPNLNCLREYDSNWASSYEIVGTHHDNVQYRHLC